MRNSILSSLLLFCCCISYGQTVYYAEPEAIPFDDAQNNIVGKISNNIIVWNYNKAENSNQILVYDYNMKLLRHLTVNAFSSKDLYKIDFINRGNYFDAVAQYNDELSFYCKVGRFNEFGEMVQPVKTLDSVKAEVNEACSFITSPNNNYSAIVKLVAGQKEGCFLLDYKLVDKDLSVVKQKQSFIPVDLVHEIISPFYMDNKGSLLFAEFVNTKMLGLPDALAIFKVEKDNDLLLSTLHAIDDVDLNNLHIQVDENNQEYLVTGIFEENKKSINGTGLYTAIINNDLSTKSKDNYVLFSEIPGLENIHLGKNKIVSMNSVVTSDGYDIKFSTNKIAQQSSNYMSNPENATVSPGNFNVYKNQWSYAKFSGRFDAFTAKHMADPLLLMPLEPMSDGPSFQWNSWPYSTSRSISQYDLNKFSEEFIIQVNEENRPSLSFVRNVTAKETRSGKLFYSAIFNVDNNLHMVFAQKSGLEKNELVNVSIRPGVKLSRENDSTINTGEYNFQSMNAIRIDDHSYLFPCNFRGMLAFARVEF